MGVAVLVKVKVLVGGAGVKLLVCVGVKVEVPVKVLVGGTGVFVFVGVKVLVLVGVFVAAAVVGVEVGTGVLQEKMSVIVAAPDAALKVEFETPYMARTVVRRL